MQHQESFVSLIVLSWVCLLFGLSRLRCLLRFMVNNPRILYYKLEYLSGQPRKAIREMKRALKKRIRQKISTEGLAWCRVGLGSLYFETGKIEKAKERY